MFFILYIQNLKSIFSLVEGIPEHLLSESSSNSLKSDAPGFDLRSKEIMQYFFQCVTHASDL